MKPLSDISNTKWNKTKEIETEIVIENEREGNFNYTNNLYHIVTNVDDGGFFNNETCVFNNVTLAECSGVSNYDSVEISVVIVLFLLIVVTVIGNTLIISAVVTTKRLRTVTNCFVTSLAAADLLVGIFVMPPAIAVHISGKFKII